MQHSDWNWCEQYKAVDIVHETLRIRRAHKMPFHLEHSSPARDSLEGSSMLSKVEGCDLLALPAELRNEIYSYHLFYIASALWPGNIIDIDTSSGRTPYGKKMPPLLQTCRQIRDEAIGILIESRVFVFFGFGRAKRTIHLGWFELYVRYMRRVELRRRMESTGYRLG